MGVGSCKVVALVIATMFFDRVGRKPMLLLSAAGLVVAYVIEAIRYRGGWVSVGVGVGVNLQYFVGSGVCARTIIFYVCCG